MSEHSTILVQTADTTTTRGRGRPQELDVQVLADNVNIFLAQVQNIVNKTPEEVGPFALTKFVISAEISANGQLILLGSGVEAGAKGALTFEFERRKREKD